MFHTKYKFDIMSETDILSEINTCRAREAWFTLLLNDPTYYETEKRKLAATIDKAMSQLARLEQSRNTAHEAANLERQTIQALYEALSAKEAEKAAKQKAAAAATRARNEAEGVVTVRKSSEEKFQEKLKQIPPEVRATMSDEAWRAIIG